MSHVASGRLASDRRAVADGPATLMWTSGRTADI